MVRLGGRFSASARRGSRRYQLGGAVTDDDDAAGLGAFAGAPVSPIAPGGIGDAYNALIADGRASPTPIAPGGLGDVYQMLWGNRPGEAGAPASDEGTADGLGSFPSDTVPGPWRAKPGGIGDIYNALMDQVRANPTPAEPGGIGDLWNSLVAEATGQPSPIAPGGIGDAYNALIEQVGATPTSAPPSDIGGIWDALSSRPLGTTAVLAAPDSTGFTADGVLPTSADPDMEGLVQAPSDPMSQPAHGSGSIASFLTDYLNRLYPDQSTTPSAESMGADPFASYAAAPSRWAAQTSPMALPLGGDRFDTDFVSDGWSSGDYGASTDGADARSADGIPDVPESTAASTDSFKPTTEASAMDSVLSQNTDAMDAQATDKGPPGLIGKNPGNLKISKRWTWQGQIGVVRKNILRFDTIENGLRAMARDLFIKQCHRGLDTIAKIATEYSEDAASAPGYIRDVSKFAGLHKDKKLDPTNLETMRKLLGAMIRQESGLAPDGSPRYDDEALNRAIGAAWEGMREKYPRCWQNASR